MKHCFPVSLKDLTNLGMSGGGFPIFLLESELPIQKRDIVTIWFRDIISSLTLFHPWDAASSESELAVLTTAHGGCWVPIAHSINSINCIDCYFCISTLLPIFTPPVYSPSSQCCPSSCLWSPQVYSVGHQNNIFLIITIIVNTLSVGWHFKFDYDEDK